jgi:hypothetical protein
MTTIVRQEASTPFFAHSHNPYQAAVQHYRAHWHNLLNDTAQGIIQFIIDTTARFKRRSRYLRYEYFLEGQDPRGKSEYAGAAPILPISRKTFYQATADLKRLGILKVRRGCYAIDYSVTALDLAMDQYIQKSVLHRHHRGGILSTIEGIIRWATNITERFVAAITKEVEPESEDSHINKGSPYTVPTYKSDRYSNKLEYNADLTFKEKLMAKADDLLASVTSAVGAKRDALKTKRKTRRNLGDVATLFEQAWTQGQKDSNPSMPVSKLMDRDRALLKSRIVIPFETTDVDPEAFALWCATHWQAIGAAHFTKSKKYPERAAFRWLVTCLDTYVTAYSQKDLLDETGSMNATTNARIAKRTTEVVEQTARITEAYSAEAEDLRLQLAASRKEATELRDRMGLETEDDPVYAKVIRTAKKKFTIGSYDDEENATPPKPKRRKLR